MPDGLRAAGSGLAAQQARLDALANDIANVSTTGYRPERVSFRDLVDGAGARAVQLGVSSRAGALVPTDDPLALAIVGPGYFQVKLADGTTALTRAGGFARDGNGDVVTLSGQRLQPPIKLPKDANLDDLIVAADGTVSLGATQLGKIQLVDVPSPQGLRAAGDGLWVATPDSGAAVAVQKPRIEQRQLEASGVDVADAMTGLIEAQRAFSLASKAVQMQDQLREIANGIRR